MYINNEMILHCTALQMLVAHACSVINACAVQGHTAPRQPFRSASHLVGMPTMVRRLHCASTPSCNPRILSFCT